MLRSVMTRVGGAVAVLLVLAAVVFVLQQVSPVDPARGLVGDKASEQVLERAREQLGLNDPLPVQYGRYVRKAVTGDLGDSIVTRRPVRTDIADFLPATLELVIAALVLALVLGIFFGFVTSMRWRGSGMVRMVLVGASSLPVFLTALAGVLIFYRRGWLPLGGRTSFEDAPIGPTRFLLVDGVLAGRPDVVLDAFKHLILPSICMAMAPAVAIGRVLRSSLQHSLRSDYVRTARAKGLSEVRVLLFHAAKNSAGPALAIGGLQVAALFASELLVEVIFAWPGIGLYTSQAIGKSDFTTIAGVTLLLGAIYVVTNAVVDVLQVLADPRMRAHT